MADDPGKPGGAAEEKRPQISPRAKLYNLTSLAFVFPVSIASASFAGYWLDGRIGTFPWLTLIFFCLGIAAGFVSLFRAVRVFDRQE